MGKDKDVKLDDLEASNSEDVKGGAGLSINTSLQSINVNSLNTQFNPRIQQPGGIDAGAAAKAAEGTSTVMCPW